MPLGRARTLALGAGLTSAVYLPLVLASAQPDSTMPFAALVLLAVVLMGRVSRLGRTPSPSRRPLDGYRGPGARDARRRDLTRYALGIVLGLAALTRNEAIWL